MAKEYKGKTNFVSARTVLWYIVFTGFAVNYMIRINLNIAIVSMVKQKSSKDPLVVSSECFGNDSTNFVVKNGDTNRNKSIMMEYITTEKSFNVGSNSSEFNSSVYEKLLINGEDSEGFDWNEFHIGMILGAFFWLHSVTQIPGGILAQKYGTKLVFGLSNYSGVVFCFFIPAASYLGYQYLAILRGVQGLLTGFAWPSMHNMAAKWIPPNERSSFVTAYLGSSVGAALTYPMCGWIIDEWGWEWVFYVNGILGTLWYIWWYLCAFDTPQEHPRISEAEKEYILSSLEECSKPKKKTSVPWKSILTSLPIWMNVLAQWGGTWGLFTIMTHAPQYFKLIHGWDIKATGLLSGMPHIFRFGFSVFFSQLGDRLLKSNKMNRTNVRKLAVLQCCVVQGLFMLCLAYSGCNYTAAIIFVTGAVAVNGAVSTGPLASLVDISPNYASIGLGLCNTIVALVGVCVPTVVGYITFENQTVVQWQKVFWLATVKLVLSGVIYLIFSNSNLQPWNSYEDDSACNESEMESLKKEVNGDKSNESNLQISEKEKQLEKIES